MTLSPAAREATISALHAAIDLRCDDISDGATIDFHGEAITDMLTALEELGAPRVDELRDQVHAVYTRNS